MIWRTTAVLCTTLGLFLTVACSSDTAMTREDYFARLAVDMQQLDADLGDLDATARAGNALSSDGVGRLEHSLRSLATDLDILNPPSDAADGHHDLRVATLNLADLFRSAATEPAKDRTGRGLTLTTEWTTACHTLQDRALAEKIDVDLRCDTALHAR